MFVYDAENSMALVDQWHFSGTAAPGTLARLVLDTDESQPTLMVYGVAGVGILQSDITAEGTLQGARTYVSSESPFLATEIVRVGSQEFVFSASRNDDWIVCWEEDPGGQMQIAAQVNIGSDGGVGEVRAMAQISRSGESFLLVASGENNTLTAIRVDESGDA
ncbi:hypothetical protein [Shimia sediminis]|uniref:hypothetical protein n=1 Tax=Shimia sediminis TaxID=2497945 RepID=UPI000F8D272C|nr:hypothetical protein [Shimia sediminis]